MIDDEFLKILRCPLSRSRVLLADDDLLAQVNSAISAGRVRNRGGSRVQNVLDGGLVDEARTVLYAVHGGVPSMLVDEAIVLTQLDSNQDCEE